MSFCACGHHFTDHYQTDVEYLCILCSWCDGYTKAAANDSATAPVPAGGTPEGLAREKVEMTDSEVKPSSPTTEAGRALFPGRNLAQKFATVTLAKILAIEQQARDEGRREAVRDVQAYGEVWATKNGRELRIPFDDLLRLAGLEAEGRSPIGSNASESPPTSPIGDSLADYIAERRDRRLQAAGEGDQA